MDLLARGQPLRLLWVEYVPEVCPVPSQPGVGHVSSSFRCCFGEAAATREEEAVDVGVPGVCGDL